MQATGFGKGLLLSCLVLSAVAAAPDKTVTIVQAYPDGIGAIVVGASQGSRWVRWKQAHTLIQAGQTFEFYNRQGLAGKSPVSKPTLSEASGEAYNVTLTHPLKSRAPLLGVSGAAWKLLPRPAVDLRQSDSRLVSAVAGFLRTQGVRRPRVVIETAQQVDLDGNGTRETVIVAASPNYEKLVSSVGELSPKKGDFSGVFLQYTVGGKSAVKMVAGEIRRDGQNDVVPQSYYLTRLADLNGDGAIEMVLNYHYYEGGGVTVAQWKGGRLTSVLECGDGL